MNKCVYRRACYVFFRLSGLFAFIFFSFFEGIVLLSICICFLGNSKFSHSLCSSLCRKKISPIIIFFRNVWLHRWKPGKLRNTFLSFRKQFLKITFSFCWSGMNLSIGGLIAFFVPAWWIGWRDQILLEIVGKWNCDGLIKLLHNTTAPPSSSSEFSMRRSSHNRRK